MSATVSCIVHSVENNTCRTVPTNAAKQTSPLESTSSDSGHNQSPDISRAALSLQPVDTNSTLLQYSTLATAGSTSPVFIVDSDLLDSGLSSPASCPITQPDSASCSSPVPSDQTIAPLLDKPASTTTACSSSSTGAKSLLIRHRRQPSISSPVTRAAIFDEGYSSSSHSNHETDAANSDDEESLTDTDDNSVFVTSSPLSGQLEAGYLRQDIAQPVRRSRRTIRAQSSTSKQDRKMSITFGESVTVYEVFKDTCTEEHVSPYLIPAQEFDKRARMRELHGRGMLLMASRKISGQPVDDPRQLVKLLFTILLFVFVGLGILYQASIHSRFQR